MKSQIKFSRGTGIWEQLRFQIDASVAECVASGKRAEWHCASIPIKYAVRPKHAVRAGYCVIGLLEHMAKDLGLLGLLMTPGGVVSISIAQFRGCTIRCRSDSKNPDIFVTYSEQSQILDISMPPVCDWHRKDFHHIPGFSEETRAGRKKMSDSGGFNKRIRPNQGMAGQLKLFA